MRIVRRTGAGGLPAAYWYLWLGMLINRVGGFGVLFLSLYLVQRRGMDASAAGLVVGLSGAGGAAGVLAGGVLADRWGRRRTLLACHLLTAGLMLALAFATRLPVIAAVTFLLGAFQSMAGPPLVAAITDVVPPADRQRAFNLQFWAHNLGVAAAGLLAGLLAEASFTLLFVVEAAATFATFLLLAVKVRETLPPPPEEPSPAERGTGLGAVFTDRVYLVFVGLTLLLAYVSTQSSTILPLAMSRDGLGPAAYGLVTACAGALIVAGQLLVPRFIAGRPKARVLALANLLVGGGFAAVALAEGVPLYLAAALVWTAGSMLAAPPNAEVIAELAPQRLRGRYQGVFYLVFPVASFAAPALGGVSLERLGDLHWVVCGAVGLLAAVGHLLAGPARERRTARRVQTETMYLGVVRR